ncbi:hypothetical protein A33M_1114 [Rhodovulum sp. PH10]|nr:hypothetical protein A33M_1114 [Rhodovulum sp. PH10]
MGHGVTSCRRTSAAADGGSPAPPGHVSTGGARLSIGAVLSRRAKLPPRLATPGLDNRPSRPRASDNRCIGSRAFVLMG